MFGWFSKTQASAFGFAIYKSIGGDTVRITEVTDDHHSPLKWNDIEYVGEVVDLVSNHPIAEAYEELSEQDIISEKDLILIDAKHKNAKQDWVSVFVRHVNARHLFGVGILMADKHPRYYGAD